MVSYGVFANVIAWEEEEDDDDDDYVWIHLNTFEYIRLHSITFEYIWIHSITFDYLFVIVEATNQIMLAE